MNDVFSVVSAHNTDESRETKCSQNCKPFAWPPSSSFIAQGYNIGWYINQADHMCTDDRISHIMQKYSLHSKLFIILTIST
jgi:hypothetical protein